MAARRASHSAGARTGSICAGVALRRVVPCAAPEPLGALQSPSTCPVCTPSGAGRSTGCTAAARAHEDPAPRTGCMRGGGRARVRDVRAEQGAGATRTTRVATAQGLAQARCRRRGLGREGLAVGHQGAWSPCGDAQLHCTPCRLCAPLGVQSSQGRLRFFFWERKRERNKILTLSTLFSKKSVQGVQGVQCPV